jgi:8-oxo-dGTP pyrophosphatase MutT (NUDIX family)
MPSGSLRAPPAAVVKVERSYVRRSVRRAGSHGAVPSEVMSEDIPSLRDAATVIVVRAGGSAPEVLLLRRHARSGFAADAWVFPGGTVDPEDRVLPPDRWHGVDAERLEARFEAPADLVLGLHVAAVRETFEEAGLLLAHRRDGALPDVGSPAYQDARARLGDRHTPFDFGAWLEGEDLVLDLERLSYHSRWVTPVQEPRRYDTRFFLARAPQGQIAAFDDVETTEQRWTTAAAALEAHAAGRLFMIFPTIRTLEAIASAGSLDDLVARAEAQAHVRRIQPHIEQGPEGMRIIHPDDPDHPDHPQRRRAEADR